MHVFVLEAQGVSAFVKTALKSQASGFAPRRAPGSLTSWRKKGLSAEKKTQPHLLTTDSEWCGLKTVFQGPVSRCNDNKTPQLNINKTKEMIVDYRKLQETPHPCWEG